MIPEQLCSILIQILGPLTEIPFLGEFFANVLARIEALCGDEEPAE
ncbi:MAG: hypothetical protein AMXMBFR4_02340 [Candidatus Hydrogenedentota bacterium]